MTPSPSSLPRSIRFTFAANIFLACCSFAIVMPSIWPYIEQMSGTTTFLAWVVAAYSAGEAAGAMTFGWLYARYEPRSLLIWSVILSGIGSGLYALAALFDHRIGLVAVFAARFIQGVGSGAEQAVEQAVVGEYVAPSYRTQATSELSTWAMLGFVIGPVCGISLSLVGGRVAGSSALLDPNSAPGAFICVCNTVMLAVTWACLRPGPRTIRSLGDSLLSRSESIDLSDKQQSGHGTTTTLSTSDLSSVYISNIIFFVHFCGFAAIETICTPLIASEFGWGVTASFALFTAAAVLSLFAMVVLGSIGGRLSDSHLVLVTLATGAVGFGIVAFDLQRDLGAVRYVTGFLLVSVAFPLGRALTLSILSKITEKTSDQGFYLGMAFAIGAIARIIGPFMAVYVQPTTLFRICAVMFAATIFMQLESWRSLI